MHTPPDIPPTTEPPKDIPPDEYNPVQDPPLNPGSPAMPEPAEVPVKLHRRG